MMFAKEEGVPSILALDARIRRRCRGREQAGGRRRRSRQRRRDEQAELRHYVKDRLNGFGGQSHPLQYAISSSFRDGRAGVRDPGRSRRRTPACNGRSVSRSAGGRRDADNLKSAVGRQAGFLTPLARCHLAVLPQRHYPSHEAYLFAIAEAMRQEYETIAARLRAPGRLSRPRHGRHIQFADLGWSNSGRWRACTSTR